MQPVTAGSLALSLTASSTASAHRLAAPTSPSGHVSQNPRVGDSDEVECGVGAQTAKAIPKFNSSVAALIAAPLPKICSPCEEDGVADECGSASLSAICAR